MSFLIQGAVVIGGVIVVPAVVGYLPFPVENRLKDLQWQLQEIQEKKKAVLEIAKENERMGQEIETLTQENEKMKGAIMQEATVMALPEKKGLEAYLEKARLEETSEEREGQKPLQKKISPPERTAERPLQEIGQ